MAYTNHGSLLAYSEPQYSLLRNLWNGIEDGRIEHAVIASARANGARSGFKRLMSHYTSRLDEKFNPTSINNAPFALALICRAALGDGNGFAKTLLDRIPEPKRSLYKAVADAMPSLSLDRDGTGQALGLAMQFLEGWKAIEPVDQSADNPRHPQQQQQQQPQGEDDSDDDSSDGDESFDDGDSLDDGEGGELAQAEADMAETTEAGEVADVPMQSFGDEDDSEDDGESSVSKSGGDEPYEDRQEQYDEQLCKSPEPDISDVFKRVRERTLVSVSLPTAPPPGRTEMRRWQSMQKDAAGLRRSARTLSKAALPPLHLATIHLLRSRPHSTSSTSVSMF